MSNQVLFWLALMIGLLVIEIITVGLTTIWFAIGALGAILIACLNLNVYVQVIIFLAISICMLIFTRPFAMKYINASKEKTNYEGLIGKTALVSSTVDNLNGTGSAIVNGQEWTARAKNDKEILLDGTITRVVAVSGVKLILEEMKEDN